MSGPGNAAAAAAGAPLPAMGGAVAPQFPYDPDPGSITGWILADSADVDDAEMVRSYQANIQRYADLPAVGAADYVLQVDNLISDCLQADELMPFLTVTIPPVSLPPQRQTACPRPTTCAG